MRIEGPYRDAQTARRDKAGGGSGEVFRADAGQAAQRAASAAPSAPATELSALLALQSVDDTTQAKRKAVRRGQSLLDALEDLKTDLLAGQMSEGKLNRLMALVRQAKLASEPGLDALVADIELRARVELAKLGRYADDLAN